MPGWQVTVTLQGQLCSKLAGCVPSYGMTWHCCSQHPASLRPPSLRGFRAPADPALAQLRCLPVARELQSACRPQASPGFSCPP